ncbi:MAG TPA: DMT family transporter [Aestuariivirgaceae bacterium]|nr:DMT family transporter [Aestuariivirgaceae bacterium]
MTGDATQPAAKPPTSSPMALDPRTAGILIFVTALVFGSVHNGLSKSLTDDLPVPLIIWWRYLGLFAIVVPWALWRYGRSAVVPARPRLHVLRGGLTIVSSLSFLVAVSGMPLADTMAIVFVYPFIITALAPLLLREHVKLSMWMAVLSGFLGVLIVMRPGFAEVDVYALLALLTGATFALVLLITRMLSVAAPPTVTATWTATIGILVLSLALPFIWVTPSLEQLALLVILSIFAATSQLMTMQAFSKAGAAVLAPFGYSEIVTATAVGFVMFADLPDVVTWLGILLIVASGVYIAIAGRPIKLPLLARSRTPGA